MRGRAERRRRRGGSSSLLYCINGALGWYDPQGTRTSLLYYMN